jgi:glutathione synthase/RimK-type ligase-like ATP-grasp enzyme
VRLNDIKAVWLRRFFRPRLSSAISDLGDRAFAQSEWSKTVDGVLASLNARFVNSMHAQRAAVKPRQLQIARQAHLRIPDTLITNDPSDARAFLQEHDYRVVHKAMTAPEHFLIDTRRWEGCGYALDEDLPFAPTIFQEEISGPDLRVTVVGGQIFTCITPGSPNPATVDVRFGGYESAEPYDLPGVVKERILEVMCELGLVFGCLDMKLDTTRDDYVFLEVNPQGQFLFVEILTGLPISRALCDLLCEYDQ